MAFFRYLSEIAPMTLRGALGTVNQLGVTVGLLLSQVLGLPLILGTKDGWPFLLGVAFIPAVLQLLLLPLCPESPRYLLISKGRVTEARYGKNIDQFFQQQLIKFSQLFKGYGVLLKLKMIWMK